MKLRLAPPLSLLFASLVGFSLSGNLSSHATAASLSLPSRKATKELQPIEKIQTAPSAELLCNRHSMAPVLEKVLPAVVSIYIKGKRPVASPQLPEAFRFFFWPDWGLPGSQTPEFREFESFGSGVIIASDGYIVTNHHVVRSAEAIEVKLQDGQTYVAKLIGGDEATDVALLKIDADAELVCLPFADSDELKIGDLVMAVGNPFGIGQTATLGMVSGLGRNAIRDDLIGHYIQTDAAINSGNSGGALVDENGQLVGMNTAILTPVPNGGNVGIGFAIPSNTVQGLTKQLMSFGEIRRGQLGITGKTLNSQLAKALGITKKRGTFVNAVSPNSAAQKAGIRAGDVIISVNGKESHSISDLQSRLAAIGAGKTVKVGILRDGQELSCSAVLQVIKSETSSKALHPALEGAVLVTQTEKTRGILVKSVAANSPAAKLGLKANDLIIGLNKQPLHSIEQLQKQLAADTKTPIFALQIQRGENELFLIFH